MNDLEYIGSTDAGNALLMFPCDGELVYFERIDHSTIRIHTVDTLQGVEQTISEFDSIEDLPESVRAAISRSQYRMRSTKSTLVGAMSDD